MAMLAAMVLHLHTQEDLDAAIHALVARDRRLEPVLAATGLPKLRRREPGFAGLASTVCGQQLSTSAAAAIWARLSAAYVPLDADAIRRARADKLGRLGLSSAKIKSLKFIAGEICSGRLDLDQLGDSPAEDAHAALTALHGIGPWTADIYLLFCLGHGDAWPTGDLAIQEAIRLALALPSRPSAKDTLVHGELWRPWRGAAAHLFWAYYRVARSAAFEAAPPARVIAGDLAEAKAGAALPAQRRRVRRPVS